jgi:hypothetical protein
MFVKFFVEMNNLLRLKYKPMKVNDKKYRNDKT